MNDTDLSMLEPLMKQYGITQEMLLVFGGAILAIMFIFLAFAIVSYVLGSIGLYTLAKNKGYANPWLAWIPFANSYLLAKTAFDNDTYGFGYLAIAVVLVLLPIPYKNYISAILGFIVFGFLFKRFSIKYVVLTVVNVITFGLLTSFFVFAIRNNEEIQEKEIQ